MTGVQIRFHGRAGQGIVTAAEITAMAAAAEGKFVQAFPFFGSEKRGPPVVAFCRISDKPIITHEQVYEPDVVVVADHTIMDAVDVEGGLAKDGIVVINTDKTPSELGVKTKKTFTVDGTRLAVEVLGKNITNTVVLGAMVKATGVVTLASVLAAVRKQFPGEMGEKNAKLVEKAFEKTVEA
ncbi:MAG: pyruvate ferredoxin oxidoreductase subunit gamma [Candidatus Micrarchaeota archaeon]